MKGELALPLLSFSSPLTIHHGVINQTLTLELLTFLTVRKAVFHYIPKHGSGSSMDHEHQHGLWQQYRPCTSAWPLMVAQASLHHICTALFLHPSHSSTVNLFITVALETAAHLSV